MSYDASSQALRCPFCGSEKLSSEGDTKTLAPEFVVPFRMTQGDAEQSLRRWLSEGFWRPSDIARLSILTKLTKVYVPYWAFSAKTHTFWNADSSRVPMGASASWYPMSGEHLGQYEGILAGASAALTPAETNQLCPFDMSEAKPRDDVDLDNVIYEQFRVQRKYARPLAMAGFEDMELAACRSLVPGSVRNLQVNVLLESLASDPIFLPVWVMAYQYRGKTYRYVVNGQTGKATGQAPVSVAKVAGAIGIVIGVIAFIVAIVICSGALRR